MAGPTCFNAMGCQRDVAAKIRSKKSDYLLAVKGNQGGAAGAGGGENS
ncbi:MULTISPECIES: hypothetical protein [Parapedobacter]|nr:MULTISPECIES: hypothetical protein [Parapedobacter]